MSDSARDPRDEQPIPIKVHDKRRFNHDGEAVQTRAAEPPPDPGEPEVDRLNRELETARKRIDELARAYQAGERDREEFKQRMLRERERMIDVERGDVAVTLVEAVDELDLCLAAAREDTSPLAKGVRLIRDGLLKKLQAAGVERLELLGTTYDPNLAEASDMEATPSEDEDGKVTAVLKACYQLKGRVVRPGRVRVGRYVKPAAA